VEINKALVWCLFVGLSMCLFHQAYTNIDLLGAVPVQPACISALLSKSQYTCFTVGFDAKKGSPYSITEHRVLALIPVLCRQPVGDVSHKPGCMLPLFSARPELTLAMLKRVPILLFSEQRHDGCEQFAYDSYPTVSQLRFEPRSFCALVQCTNHSATENLW